MTVESDIAEIKKKLDALQKGLEEIAAIAHQCKNRLDRLQPRVYNLEGRK